MNREDDRIYYTRRAQQERERAEQSPTVAICRVHQTFAAEYERRAEGTPGRAQFYPLASAGPDRW